MLIRDDCIKAMQGLEANSIDSLITDPPAGISFMGKDWDHDKGGREQWITWMTDVMRECLRVLKPGAHGLVWAIPRTSHWTATALENAGFEVRDVITHLFGSGFPKSLNISKQIGKQYGCQFIENANRATKRYERFPLGLSGEKTDSVVAHVVIQQGEGPELPTEIGVEVDLKDQTDTLLFESTEPTDLNMIWSLKKRLAEDLAQKNSAITLTELKTITGLKIWNLLQYPNTLRNTISLNGTSLKPASEHWIMVRKPLFEKTVAANAQEWGCGGLNIDASRIGTDVISTHGGGDKMSGMKGNGNAGVGVYQSHVGRFPANLVLDEEAAAMLDGASRFFYCAKASKRERGEGNTHPTVKSLKLMQYLIRLITPPGGTVLDPFMGSGSTGVAAKGLCFKFVGIERDESYFEIAAKRIK